MTEYPPPPPGNYPPPPPGNYPPPPPGNYPPPPPPGYGGQVSGAPTGTNGLATASLVCSLVGLLCGIGSIVGIVLGFIAMKQIKQTGQAGHGLALAGVIVGAASLVIGVLAYILYFSVS